MYHVLCTSATNLDHKTGFWAGLFLSKTKGLEVATRHYLQLQPQSGKMIMYCFTNVRKEPQQVSGNFLVVKLKMEKRGRVSSAGN